MSYVIRSLSCMFITALCAFLPAHAAEKNVDPAVKLERDAKRALDNLTAKVSSARSLRKDAVAILVFPRVGKAGFVVAGQHGRGALLRGGKAVDFFETAGISAGFQAGAQTYGYALFFMNEGALSQLDRADGFEIGVGPSVVVVDEGFGRNLTTTTAHPDIYAFVFGQKGLMAGMGVQGNKVSRAAPR